MADENTGTGGSYIRKADGSLKLVGRTEPAPQAKAVATAEAAPASEAAEPVVAAEEAAAKTTKKKET